MHLVLINALLFAQSGQSRGNLNWPCGATINRSYLVTSEASGGHLMLFAPSEVSKSGAFFGAEMNHKQTILRASGIALASPQEFSFPVESGVESIFLIGQVQCLDRVQFFRPTGAELVNDSSSEITDYKAGRMIRLPNPEPGMWRIRIAGRGVFSVSALARTNIAAGVEVSAESITAHVPDTLRDVQLSLVSADDKHLAAVSSDGKFAAPDVPYRVKLRAVDGDGNTVQRVHPNLYGLK